MKFGQFQMITSLDLEKHWKKDERNKMKEMLVNIINYDKM